MRVIRELFDFTVTKDILQVPLVEDVMVDRLVWKKEQHGSYSVRSGYHIWRKARKRNGGVAVNGNWNSLWKISAPARDAKSVIIDICCKEGSNIVGRVTVMIEGLWRNRNDWVWNKEKEEATKLVESSAEWSL
ncbi:uncharacterized protein LOC131659311 [Vicia villosa]|uniref:uncharacterized protein LOC131659311 n=1 Tax=Vicia villosa TaxID=3911 RepID=UPI00273CE1B4|nr:uncharacterized protein LOC131659311 [Vicia villosa]